MGKRWGGGGIEMGKSWWGKKVMGDRGGEEVAGDGGGENRWGGRLGWEGEGVRL